MMIRFNVQTCTRNYYIVHTFHNAQFYTMRIQTRFGIPLSLEFQVPNTRTSKHKVWHCSSIPMPWDIRHWSQCNIQVLNVYIQTERKRNILWMSPNIFVVIYIPRAGCLFQVYQHVSVYFIFVAMHE